jgi:hypothetical protein
MTTTKHYQTMRVLVGQKIAAQKKLIAKLGLDEDTWARMTQKQLDEFWARNCSDYVLIHVNDNSAEHPDGEVKYVLFDSIEANGRIN